MPNYVWIYPLSAAIVSIFSQYAGYSYIVDDEVVIVAPESREVVATFNEGGGPVVV